MSGDQVPWPPPPRDPGPWDGGPPVAPPGNTPLPPLPGAGGVVHGGSAPANPWSNPETSQPIAIAVPGQDLPPTQPPPGTSLRPDRAPTWLLVASIVVILAVIAGGAYVLLRGGRQYPSAWDGRVAEIAEWVAEERELDFFHPVQVNFLEPDEYRALTTRDGGDLTEQDQDALADQAAQLRALGFISGEVDLNQAGNTLNDSGTLAYYDPTVEQVFVRGAELTPALRVTIAHELVHVLQDQHFDLERLGEVGSTEASVLRALAEGDAGKVERAYVEDVLSDEERSEYLETSAAEGQAATEALETDVPPILTTIFAAPYILGPEMIALLYEEDGWAGINDALEDPPSEEALFDPLTLGTDALDPVEASVTEPDGVEVLDRDEFGPTAWYLLLAARIGPDAALTATDGWGGDEYVVYRTDGTVCVAIAVATDTADDAVELRNALDAWVADAPDGSAEVTAEGDLLRLRSCDPGVDADPIGDDISPEVLVLPVTRTQLFVQGRSEGADDRTARCFATGMMDELSFDEIVDPALTPESVAERAQQVALSCT